MAKINLLPKDLGPKASVLKLARLLKSLGIILFILFLIGGSSAVFYIFLLTTKINNSKISQNNFRERIASLEKTEQSLFLMKDRLGKIKTIYSLNEARNYSDGISYLMNSANLLTITNFDFIPGKIKVSGSSLSHGVLDNYIFSVRNSSLYKKVSLTNLSYNSTSGYLFSLEVEIK